MVVYKYHNQFLNTITVKANDTSLSLLLCQNKKERQKEIQSNKHFDLFDNLFEISNVFFAKLDCLIKLKFGDNGEIYFQFAWNQLCRNNELIIEKEKELSAIGFSELSYTLKLFYKR